MTNESEFKGAASTLWNQRERKHLQIEPANSFGVVGIEAMPLNAVLRVLSTLAYCPFRDFLSTNLPGILQVLN
jgi:hypothetical protein